MGLATARAVKAAIEPPLTSKSRLVEGLSRGVESIQTLGFDVEGAYNRFSRLVQDRDDDLRARISECLQVMRISSQISDVPLVRVTRPDTVEDSF